MQRMKSGMQGQEAAAATVIGSLFAQLHAI